MNILRNILAVIVGYVIFAVGAVMLFELSGVDPHAEAGVGAMLTVLFFGAVFAFAGGYMGKLIAATRTILANLVLAFLMAGFAAVSLFMSTGSHYTQLAAILLFAPMSLLGGFLRRRSEI